MAWWNDIFRRNYKVSATAGVVAQQVSVGRPLYTPRNYETLAKEGYSGNVYVYRAIMEIAKATASIPWKLFSTGRKLTEIDDHPLLDLMRGPNRDDGGVGFWKKIVAYWFISGNAYIEAVFPLTRGGAPIELWCLRPDRMKVIPSKFGVSGYEYGTSMEHIELPTEKILHLKMLDPLNDWYGMSPIVVAGKIIDQMNAANDWNTALFQNGARPDGVLSTDDVLADDARATVKADLRKLYQGSKNARRPIVLESGLKWQQIGMNPTDLDWLKGKEQAAREIAIAIGVAPELIGDSANKTYSNVQEARKALYSETVVPLAHELRDALNNWLVPMYADNLRLDIDLSGIQPLQEDMATKRSFALAGLQGGLLTLNAALKMIGEEEIDPVIGDVRYVPSNVIITPTEALIPDEEEEDGDDLPPTLLLPPPGFPAPVPLDIPTDQDPAGLTKRRRTPARPRVARTIESKRRAA